jgi:hypothetical protein
LKRNGIWRNSVKNEAYIKSETLTQWFGFVDTEGTRKEFDENKTMIISK